MPVAAIQTLAGEPSAIGAEFPVQVNILWECHDSLCKNVFYDTCFV